MTEVQTHIPVEDDFFVSIPKLIEKAKQLYREDPTQGLKQIAIKCKVSPVYLRSILNANQIMLGQHQTKTESRWGNKDKERTEKRNKENSPTQPPKTMYAASNTEKKRMKIVTINIPDQYLDCVESMVNLGFFPSRSEAVREAIKQFLTNESELNNGLDKNTFQLMKEKQMRDMIK